LYNQAVTTINDKTYAVNPTVAYQQFVSSCYADPTFGLAWYGTGNANSDLNKIPASIACYRRALECANTDSDRAKMLCNIGWRLHCIGETQEACDLSEEASRLDPSLSLSWLNLSMVYGTQGDPEQAVRAARKGYALAPDDPQSEMALSFALLFNREFEEGFKHFECRFKYKLHNFLNYPYPPWNGEPDKTVFLVADQGLGDTISFARFVEQACSRAKFVHAAIQPELMRLFQHAFIGVKNLNLLPNNCHFPPADCWSTFVSLPYALELSDAEIRNTPHISVPKYSLPKTWKVEDRKLHIGIAWRGSALNEINEHRSIPITQFLDLYKVPGIQLYSLQVDENRQQLADNGCAAVINDLGGYIRDVVDTLTLMRDLDLIITCESALGHIATLAGIETWLPYSYLGKDYRVGLQGDDQLWSKHRIFPQGQDQQWKPVFEKIAQALKERVGV
jgi:tetratricopeptide (TPR) repeat protein